MPSLRGQQLGIPTLGGGGSFPAPTGLSPSGLITPTAPTITWDAVPSATDYTVTVYNDAGTPVFTDPAATSLAVVSALVRADGPFTVEVSANPGGAVATSTFYYYETVLLDQGYKAIWRLGETSGTTATDITGNVAALNGTYVGGVTLNATTFPAGTPAPLFDASAEVITLPVANLNTVFNPLAGTMMIWIRPRVATIWTDAVSRVPMELGADANNRVFFNKTSQVNRFDSFFRANSVSAQNVQSSYSPNRWICRAITWDSVVNEVISYADGVQVGPTLAYPGTWAGALVTNFSAIGNFSGAGGSGFWDGYITFACLDTRAHTPTEIAAAVIPSFLV